MFTSGPRTQQNLLTKEERKMIAQVCTTLENI